MSRLRILLLAPDCNPEGITIPLEGYCQAEALAQLRDVTLVTRPASDDALRRSGSSRAERFGPVHDPWPTSHTIGAFWKVCGGEACLMRVNASAGTQRLS